MDQPRRTSEPDGSVGDERVDLVTIGETMVGLVSDNDPRRFTATMAGAESNVAVGMAQLGRRARWVSRVGDDPLGRFLCAEVAARGVDVAVQRDPVQPTGVLTKHVTEGRAVVRYYRGESAARALSLADLQRAGHADRIHLTGITLALSASAAALVEGIVDRSAGFRGPVSFDVNYRSVLWADVATAARSILHVARQADVVFIGDDEAEALFGTSDAARLAELIVGDRDHQLVLKRGAAGATVVTAHGVVAERGLVADVADPTGAGDAFAAGYLAASCSGWSLVDRLRLGHVMGARTVAVLDETPPPFASAELAELSPDGLAVLWG